MQSGNAVLVSVYIIDLLKFNQLHFILLWYFVVFFQTVIHFAIGDFMSQRNSIYIYSQASRPGLTQPTLLAALKLIELASEIS